MKTTHEVFTKKDKDAKNVKTILILDWEGATDEQIRSLATRQLVVSLQGRWRGAKEAIPGQFTFRVADYGPRAAEPVTVETTLARANALSEEERKALLAQLQASLKPASGAGAHQQGARK